MSKLKEIQEHITGMMKEVDMLFKANDITYTMLYGSVLGGVRHNGFIPWDDDMDIGILRKDYPKAEKLLQNLKGLEYFPSEDSVYSDAPIGRLRKVIDKNKNHTQQPTIDFFPLDYVPKSESGRKKIRLLANVFHMCVLRKAPKNRGKLIRLVVQMVLFLSPAKFLDYLQVKIKEKMLAKDIEKDKCIVSLFGGLTEKEYFPESMYHNLIYVDFENIQLPIPKDYHHYLTQIYGDYMKLPPIEERKPKHLQDLES